MQLFKRSVNFEGLESVDYLADRVDTSFDLLGGVTDKKNVLVLCRLYEYYAAGLLL